MGVDCGKKPEHIEETHTGIDLKLDILFAHNYSGLFLKYELFFFIYVYMF